ncbi:hypothetical protein ABH966_003559 [Lysinibacillus sp. RC46]|uniref:hypothetical protein n=1 Tax=Lysinibacillus sp. RC46 TaxID=3156295 RepID=UPI003517C1A1
MRKLKYFDNEYEAEIIVKKENSIEGYIDDSKVFSFNGVTDFTNFTLEDGESFDKNAPLTELELLRMEISKNNAEIIEFIKLMSQGDK